MKKLLFLFSIMLLAACSEDNEPVSNQQPDGPVAEVVTKENLINCKKVLRK